VTDISLAYGGMAGIPKRASNTEHHLLGKHWNQENIDLAKSILREEFSPLTDWRASASYRTEVSANLLQRFFDEQ